MQVATTGLVLRQVKVGEADRILTILTPDLGVVSASARGSLRMKSALFSATGLFCYSEFTLTSGRSHYFVDTAQVKKVFHGISASIEGMALASYMAEIAAELSPAPPEADAQLRLLLNCLYMISERHYPCAQLKAIYELRALTLAGYMPAPAAHWTPSRWTARPRFCSGHGRCSFSGRVAAIYWPATSGRGSRCSPPSSARQATATCRPSPPA